MSLTPLNLASVSGAQRIGSLNNLFTVPSLLNGDMLLRQVSNFAEAIACGGVLLSLRHNGVDNCVIYIGDIMHHVNRAGLLQSIPFIRKKLRWEDRLVGADDSGTRKAIAVAEYEYHLQDASSGSWHYCGVLTKAASGFGLSGALMYYASRAVHETAFTAEMYADAVAHLLSNPAATPQAINHDGITQALWSLVRIPWYRSLKAELNAQRSVNGVINDGDAQPYMDRAFVEKLNAMQDSRPTLNIPVFQRYVPANGAGTPGYRVSMSRELNCVKFFALANPEVRCGDIWNFDSKTLVAGPGVSPGYWANSTNWRKNTGVALLPAGTKASNIADTVNPYFDEQQHGAKVGTNIAGLGLPLLHSTRANSQGMALTEERHTGPLRAIGTWDIRPWMAPAYPMMYYDHQTGERVDTDAVVSPEDFVKPLQNTLLISDELAHPSLPNENGVSAWHAERAAEQWELDIVPITVKFWRDTYRRARQLAEADG